MSENSELSNNASVLTSNECKSDPVGLTEIASNISDDNSPRILCNELLVDPSKIRSIEKLDELSSLEREIAKMHHVDETNLQIGGASSALNESEEKLTQITSTLEPSTAVIDESDGKKSIVTCGSSNADVSEKLNTIASGETALEHEDLIAVLKGLDGNADENLNSSVSSSILEGVTIEGEGEYQIMEVIDEDSNTTEDTTKQVDAYSDSVAQSLNKTKTFGSTLLTAQEERALALEQIEGLKTANRRRKQDIKPIKQIDPALDLVSALEADWSENDDETSENTKSCAKTKMTSNKKKKSSSSTSEYKTKSPSINVSAVTTATTVPSTTAPSTNYPSMSDVHVGDNNSRSEDIKEVMPSLTGAVIETKTEKDTQVVSGFRRTRVIKRKIIWDPDAPETTFSYAKLVKPNSISKTKTEPTVKAPIKKGSTTITAIKKETMASENLNTLKKPLRPITPKAKKTSADMNPEKNILVKSEKNSGVNTTEQEDKKSNDKTEDSQSKIESNLENKSSPTTTLSKRRSQTPVSNGLSCGAGVKKKKITELDRLMGDEGAVNMLNSLERLEATIGTCEAKSSRPMMRSRAATICDKLPRKDTSPNQSTSTIPPAATNSQANKTKRTPKSRASSSWDYVYKKKKQDFEDSLIIRRRSNSSYSSTTSQNRLSLDGPPASIANNNSSNSSIKCNDSTSSSISKNENDLSKKPTTSNHSKNSSNSKTRSIPTPPAGKSFEFAKPENKKTLKHTKNPAATLTNDMKKAATVANRRNTRSPAISNEDKGKDVTKSSASLKTPINVKDKKDITQSPAISDVIVKKSSKVAQILFGNGKAKLKNTFTIQMMNKLTDILDNLASDPDCHVVVIGTNDAHFCQGVDITDLTTISEDKRKNYAVNLANSVKNYLKTLATFPKPIIGGVSGNLVNLGVIQLALFDVVIASDKTTFETTYPKLGQTPEGYCLWHNMNKIRGSFKTKLFWLCEKVQSTEAALAGLVNKLTAANKINDDALMAAKRIASFSPESYRVMKKTTINSHLDAIVNTLDEEFNTIVKQWTSTECLENLRKYIVQDVTH